MVTFRGKKFHSADVLAVVNVRGLTREPDSGGEEIS